ncbi:MAG: hypothetical protein LKG11_04935 [Bacilli bacterium]|jgi:hypothetical protein|nr:hypothetical protein [Bacilli bacterium]
MPFKKHFRKYRKSNHPSLIVGDDGRAYDFIGLTHSPYSGGHKCHELSSNPDPRDPRKSYLRRELRSDSHHSFRKPIPGWRLGKADEAYVDSFVSGKRRKKN